MLTTMPSVIHADHLQRLFPELALEIVQRPVPKKADDAKRLLRAFLARVVGPEDRWGNFPYNHRGTQHRYNLGDKVIRDQYRYGSEWKNADSASLIEEAMVVYTESARMTNRTDLLEKLEKKASSRKSAAAKGAEARGRERARTEGAGFYVINSNPNASMYSGLYMADHETPFPTVERAIDRAKDKFAEVVGLKFSYLLPVAVIEADSRSEANHGRGHVWWINGKYRGAAEDPRQIRIPGASSGRSVVEEDEGRYHSDVQYHLERLGVQRDDAIHFTNTRWVVVAIEEGRRNGKSSAAVAQWLFDHQEPWQHLKKKAGRAGGFFGAPRGSFARVRPGDKSGRCSGGY